MGYLNTTRRAAFINALANALPQMMGNETTQPLWPFLENLLGADSFKKTNYEMVRAEGDAMGSFDFTLAASVGNELIAGYIAGELDEVHVVFGEFQGMGKQPPYGFPRNYKFR